MCLKLAFSTSLLFISLFYLQAQQPIEIKDASGFKAREECTVISELESHPMVSSVRFKDKFIYTGYHGKLRKNFALYMIDLNTCEETKGLFENALPNSLSFGGLSPNGKLAIVETYNYPLKEYMVINDNGEKIWKFKWDIKNGETMLVVMNAKVDNEGNASFFVRSDYDPKNPSYAFLYKNINDDELKLIGYRLEVNGRVTFRSEFDQTGNIHFMGTYTRKNDKGSEETKRGVFHGKINPKEDDKLKTTLYPFDDVRKFDSRWELLDYRIDDGGNTTLCAIGQYLKSGAGRDYSKVFMIQIDNTGNVNWSHLINTINLRKEIHLLEGKFFKIGKKYAFMYFDNDKYINYGQGIDIDKVSSEVPRNDLQMFVVDEAGKLTKHRVASIKETGKTFPFTEELEESLYLSYKTGKKLIY